LLFYLIIGCSKKNTEKNKIETTYKTILNENEFQLDSMDKDRMIVDLILEAKQHEDIRDYSKALIAYKNALELDTTASLLYMEGNSYFNLDVLHKAKRSLKKALLIEPDFEDALRKLIEIYLIEDDTQRAKILISELETICDLYNSTEIVAKYYSRVNPEKAIDIYERLYTKYKDKGYENELLRLYSLLEDKTKYYDFLKENIFKTDNYNVNMTKSLTLNYINENMNVEFNELLDHIDNNFSQEDLMDFYNSLANYIYSNYFDVSEIIKTSYLNHIDNKFIFDTSK
jgi:tetratricopeptide (TPR) repeat protein